MNENANKATVTTTSSSLMQAFSVAFEFPVCFTQDLFNPDNPLLRDTLARLEPAKRHRTAIIIDAGVQAAMPELQQHIKNYARHFYEHIDLVAEPLSMPGGESVKSDWQAIERMQNYIQQHRIDRHSYVIGIGGGALLDAVGLVAATAHRGLRHIRVPTTVLAQNDSGVGVKNGINLFGQKNYLGTFAPPFAVLNDYEFITHLPVRDKIAGMAEAVKVALIRDAEFFQWIEQHANKLAQFDAASMRYLIKRCAELHMHQIAHGGDPFETGSARPLDFGHWAAHRMETLSDYQLRHGEAVAIGIALDTHYSVLSGLLDGEADERVSQLLEQLGFELWHPCLEIPNSNGQLQVLQGLNDFREHLGGELTITLLQDLGTGVEVHSIDSGKVLQSVTWLKHRHSAWAKAS